MDAQEISELFSELYPLAESIGGALEINGGAFALLARKIKAAKKPVGAMTVAELAAVIDEAGVEYNRMYLAEK